jgi:type VI protein secretion system component VasK
MWRWLVVLAIVALWLEWWLYYAARERQRAAEVQEAPGDRPLPELDPDLEEQEESAFRNPNCVGR